MLLAFGCIDYLLIPHWGVWSTSSLPLLSGSLWSEVLVPFRIPSKGQIDLFINHSHLIGLCPHHQKQYLKKQHKKCKYKHTMNVIPKPLCIK